jgi:single-strand DNA-binding protein
MSRTLNKVMLIGNVGKAPELKFTPSGIPVTSFRLATTETWKGRDGSLQEHTDWHTVVAWRGLAEVIQRLVKRGSRVYIEGKLQSRSFDDKNGSRRHIVEVLAENMLLLEARRTRDNEDDQHADGDFIDADFADDYSIDSDFDTDISSDSGHRDDEMPF